MEAGTAVIAAAAGRGQPRSTQGSRGPAQGCVLAVSPSQGPSVRTPPLPLLSECPRAAIVRHCTLGGFKQCGSHGSGG